MPISSEESILIGKRISRIEPRFKAVVSDWGPCPIGITKSSRSNFEALASSILSQQLSTKAAATITSRVRKISGGRLSAEKISKLSVKKLRSVGCSDSKARSLLELARATSSKELPLRRLNSRSDQEVYELLLPIYGIGRWTVDMFLMFQLGRLDIWPTGDLGVRRGWERLHGMTNEISIAELTAKGDRFAPYRSHLAWYCWRANEALRPRQLN